MHTSTVADRLTATMVMIILIAFVTTTAYWIACAATPALS